MRQDGDRPRHRDMGADGQKMRVQGLDISTARGENDDIISDFDAYRA